MTTLSIQFLTETNDTTLENLEVTQVGSDLYRINEDICAFLVAETKDDR